MCGSVCCLCECDLRGVCRGKCNNVFRGFRPTSDPDRSSFLSRLQLTHAGHHMVVCVICVEYVV